MTKMTPMKGLIFSEGNGYGHAARDKIIAERFGYQLMTFGKGAEYCRDHSMDFIEIPPPYEIKASRGKVNIVSDPSDILKFMKPDVLATINSHFRKSDFIIVDGTPLGLALAMLARRKAVYITNDISALVGMQGIIEKRIALSTQNTLLRFAKAVIIPDYPPPMTITMLNIRSPPKLEFVGPMVERTKQVKHGKRFLVSGTLDGDMRSMLGESAVYGNEVGDMRPYYQDAELVLSHGGHTTIMESLSFGKPVLCVVEKSYSERRNNALMMERLGVGIHLDKDLLNARSLMASIAFAKTLGQSRLDAYKEMAGALDPLKSLERIFTKI
jgi:UDP-N-acetylglucosamine--N-acetylmuramyl-(pentapeptide) pyrophosphoryl-undecaprenol N-acetylglucosamine transferase